VITKVHAQSERGFRRCLGRAPREGCKPAELLDALLKAFAALGLTKIVWLVGIMLAMDLRDFQPQALRAGSGRWHDVMAAAELPDGVVRRVECDGRSLFVCMQGGALRVYDSRCPHQGDDIAHPALQGHTLTCPKHGWAFDARSGDGPGKGTRPLRRWPAAVQDGRRMARR
jgi:nitrite reductase/ring-hydroxylating ferredoxin subunit